MQNDVMMDDETSTTVHSMQNVFTTLSQDLGDIRQALSNRHELSEAEYVIAQVVQTRLPADLFAGLLNAGVEWLELPDQQMDTPLERFTTIMDAVFEKYIEMEIDPTEIFEKYPDIPIPSEFDLWRGQSSENGVEADYDFAL